eukprot:619291-Prymnesium_polylepis.1
MRALGRPVSERVRSETRRLCAPADTPFQPSPPIDDVSNDRMRDSVAARDGPRNGCLPERRICSTTPMAHTSTRSP